MQVIGYICSVINVLLFGRLAEISGQSSLLIDLPDTDAVCAKIRADFPEMKNLSFAVAVNQKLIINNTKLADGDEVALMPPYSGG
jgi:molybdopterin converting factor small subunit